jgi:hypothetical protein
LVCPFILAISTVRAESVTIEVQGVAASDAGKKEQNIPSSLTAFKNVLKDSVYGTFKDAGHQKLKIKSGGNDAAAIGNYGVDVTLVKVMSGKARVEVTIKDGGNPIGKPISTTLTKGQPIMVSQLGSKDAPTILIFTLKDD